MSYTYTYNIQSLARSWTKLSHCCWNYKILPVDLRDTILYVTLADSTLQHCSKYSSYNLLYVDKTFRNSFAVSNINLHVLCINESSTLLYQTRILSTLLSTPLFCIVTQIPFTRSGVATGILQQHRFKLWVQLNCWNSAPSKFNITLRTLYNCHM